MCCAPHGPLITSWMRLSIAPESQAKSLQEESLFGAIQHSQTYKVIRNYPQSCPKFDEVRNFSILPRKCDLTCPSPKPCAFPAWSWGPCGQIGCLWQGLLWGSRSATPLVWRALQARRVAQSLVLTSSPQTCWDPR